MGGKDLVSWIEKVGDDDGGGVYGDKKVRGWRVDKYGGIWIGKKGGRIEVRVDKVGMYEGGMKKYEGKRVEVKDGKM